MSLHPDKTNRRRRMKERKGGNRSTSTTILGLFLVLLSLLLPTQATLVTSSTATDLPLEDEFDIISQQQQNKDQQPRSLAIGDFDVLNDLYSDSSIAIPDVTVRQTVVGFTLTLDLTEGSCQNVTVGDVTIDWFQRNDREIAATVRLIDFDISCQLDYRYRYIFGTNGNGIVDVFTRDNTVTALLVFESPSFRTSPPDAFEVERCEPIINVYDLDFEGVGGPLNLVANLLNAIESSIRSTVAGEIEDFLCKFFTDADEEIGAALTKVTDLLEPYLAPTDPVNPLIVENSLQVPANVTLLDFQNPGSTFANVADLLVEEFSKYFGNTVDDGKGGTDLNINILLRAFALESDGALRVDFATIKGLGDGLVLETTNLLGSFGVSINTIEIYGLDSLTRFDDLSQLGSQTLATAFAMDSLSVILGAELELRPPGDTTDKRVLETGFIQIALDPIEVSAAILLAIDEDKLGAFKLGSLLDTDTILSCLFATLFRLAVTELSVEPVVVRGINVAGFESPGLQRVLSSAFDLTYVMFESTLLDALPGFLQTYILNQMNEALEARYSISVCAQPRLDSSDTGTLTFMDFRDLLLPADVAAEYGGSGTEPYDSVAAFAKGFVDDELKKVDAVTGIPSINDSLIASYTEKQSGTKGTLVFEETLVKVDTTFNIGGFDGRIQFRIDNVRLENLDSIGLPISLLEPVRGESLLLNNAVTIGADTSPSPFRISADVLIAITSDETRIRNEVGIGIDLRSANVVVTALLKMLKDNLYSFPVEDIFELDCWLATIPAPLLNAYGLREDNSSPTLGLSELSVLVDDMNFTFDCFNCSTAKLNEITDLLASPGSREDAVESANNVLDFVLSLAGGDDSFLQTRIDRYLVEAPKRCRHSPEYDVNAQASQYESLPSESTSDDNIGFLLALLAATSGVIFVLVLTAYTIRWIVARRHRKWLESLPQEKVTAIYREQHLADKKAKERNALTQPMVRSKVLPALVRYLVPVVLIANIGLFLSGHLSLGVGVQIYLRIGKEELVVNDFYSFSIAQSANELWNAGAKELAFLMLIFSAVWPYSKQIITLALWFLPPRMVSVSRRGTIFLWLDALAKWSMIDVFVMIVTIIALRVTISSPDQTFLPDDLYRVDLLVVPLWGLYANVLAQLLSQVCSHAIVHYHRRIVQAAEREHEGERQGVQAADKGASGEESEAKPLTSIHSSIGNVTELEEAALGSEIELPAEVCESDVPKSLFHHAYVRPHRGESDKLFLRPGVNAGVMMLALALIGCVIVGCVTASIAFDFQGIVGVAVESGQDFDEAREQLSVISIAQLLMAEGRFLDTAKDRIGLGSIASLLVLTTLVVPILLVFFLLIQWFYPLGRESRGKISTTVEILQAWQYMEVYLIATIVGAWQIGDVSEFLVNSYCEDLQATFTELVYYGILNPEDAQCFRVKATVESAAIILVVAAVFLDLLNLFVSKAVAQYRTDGEADTREPLVDTTEDDKGDLVVPLEQIHPVPVLFTDRFRWLLRREKSQL